MLKGGWVVTTCKRGSIYRLNKGVVEYYNLMVYKWRPSIVPKYTAEVEPILYGLYYTKLIEELCLS